MARHSRPGEDAPAEVLSGLIRVYCEGLEAGARYLTACLTMAAQNRMPPRSPARLRRHLR